MIIGDAFIGRNNLVELKNIGTPLFVIAGDGRYGEFETLKGKTGHLGYGTISAPILSSGINVQLHEVITEDSWAIVDADNNLYFACNQLQLDGVTNIRRAGFTMSRKINKVGVDDAY